MIENQILSKTVCVGFDLMIIMNKDHPSIFDGFIARLNRVKSFVNTVCSEKKIRGHFI